MARIGQIVSAAGHIGLILWIILGDIFGTSEPVELPEITEVSIVSESEFSALSQEPQASQTPPAEAPKQTPPPLRDLPPEPPAEEAAPKAADRVAPIIAEAPEPDAEVTPEAPEPELEPTPDPKPQTPPPERPRKTAPPETGEVLKTEANADQKEAPPQRQSEPAPTPSIDVSDALAAALAETQSAQPAAGGSLNSSEIQALRAAIAQCWNIGALSTDAMNVTVTLRLRVGQDRVPDAASITFVDATGGSNDAGNRAYEAARRAIIRCGARGLPLPPDKYAEWREMEISFNPSEMRLR